MNPKPAALGGAADPVSGAAALLVDPRDPKEAARTPHAARCVSIRAFGAVVGIAWLCEDLAPVTRIGKD